LLRWGCATFTSSGIRAADAQKIGIPIDPMTGEETTQLFESFYAAPKSVVERAKFVMNN
jgi:hypothetical protein